MSIQSDHSSHPSTLKTYLSDPLSILLVDRLSLSPIHCGLIAIGIALLVDVVSYVLAGSEVVLLSGWTDTWVYVAYLYVVYPVIIGAYAWIAHAPARLFCGLRQSEALVASEVEYDRFVLGTLQARFNHTGWTVASLGLLALLAVYYAFVYAMGWPGLARILRAI